MRLVFTPSARHEFREAYRYIAEHNPIATSRFHTSLSQSLTHMSHYPEAYPVYAVYDHHPVRRYIYRDYNVFYRVIADRVEIIHILHHSRDMNILLGSTS